MFALFLLGIVFVPMVFSSLFLDACFGFDRHRMFVALFLLLVRGVGTFLRFFA
ncbi:hypothetical protein LguiA_023233 [Lonicera macranthoides]